MRDTINDTERVERAYCNLDKDRCRRLFEYAEKDAFQRGLSEGRKQGMREAVSIMKRHPEGEGEWCDTGEDMEWACRSECVERAVKRIVAALKGLEGK